jgi:hypothetical protein
MDAMLATDWGHVVFWTVFGVVVAALFLAAYLLFRFKRHYRDRQRGEAGRQWPTELNRRAGTTGVDREIRGLSPCPTIAGSGSRPKGVSPYETQL